MKFIQKKIQKPFTNQNILKMTKKYKTPFWAYNKNTIIKQIKKLKKFDVIRYAQKACSNIHILKIMKQNGIKIDAVSEGEIERALVAGFSTKKENIVFTGDIFEKKSLKKIIKHKILVNIGSLNMIKQLGKKSPNHKIWLRINPKFGSGHSYKTNTGGENSKHGIWNPKKAIPLIKKYNLKLKGLHIHIGSGANLNDLKKTCLFMEKIAIELNQKIDTISAGGGIPIPYKKKEKNINIQKYYKLWNQTKKKLSQHFKKKISLEIEPGRFLIAESGILVSQIKTIKKTKNNKFILVNVGFNDLLRPVMYGSYHHISIIPNNRKTKKCKKNEKVIIGGPLCESGDIFTQKKEGKIRYIRLSKKAELEDYVIFHNTGAYGSSMSSNYNSRPLIKEILFYKKKTKIIRKEQSIQELINLEINT